MVLLSIRRIEEQVTGNPIRKEMIPLHSRSLIMENLFKVYEGFSCLFIFSWQIEGFPSGMVAGRIGKG